jgi:hypothetical protein
LSAHTLKTTGPIGEIQTVPESAHRGKGPILISYFLPFFRVIFTFKFLGFFVFFSNFFGFFFLKFLLFLYVFGFWVGAGLVGFGCGVGVERGGG